MENIRLSFNLNGINHTLTIPDDSDYSDNLPYDIAEMMRILIKESNVNEDIVIKELIDAFDYHDDEDNPQE